MGDYKYKAICHTSCYWKETLWQIGEIYEGDDPPNKHFSKSGKTDPTLPPPDAGSDKRSNKQLRIDLKKDHNFSAPKNWTRKQLWGKIAEIERSQSIDALYAEVDKKPVGRPPAPKRD